MLAWLNAHEFQIYALFAAMACIAIAKVAIPFIGRSAKERGKNFARWSAFGFYVVGGAALAVAMVPLLNWVMAQGAAIGNVTAIVALALGWHAVAMITSVTRDLFDKTPDHEARSGALWIPTFVPIGFAAVVKVVQNPQGLGQGLTAAIMALITLIYVYKIVKRADQAKEHKNVWNWVCFGVCFLGGLVLVPLIAYIDTMIGGVLPGVVANIVRVGVGLLGLVLVAGGVYDIWCDGEPHKKARAGALAGLGITLVYGGIAWGAMTGAWGDGASFLNGVF
jgi:hypothetical protein